MKFTTSITCFVLFLNSFLIAQNKPFPQHVKYTGGILPTYSTQDFMDADVKKLYDIWKEKYFKNGCDSGQSYIDFTNTENTTISTSEGMGYGMMITAYMAGYDDSAKINFDRLYYFWLKHQAYRANLMAWKQNTGCTMLNNDKYTATDGDIDIAYAFLLADAQWGSTGAINYKEKALNVMTAILGYQTNGNILKLGDWYNSADAKYGTSTRSSDFIIDHLRAFKAVSGVSKWGDIINTCYAIVDSIRTNYSKTYGLMPDFIIKANTKPAPVTTSVSSPFLETENDSKYYYNACRFPWRIGTDYLVSGDIKAYNAAYKISNFIKTRSTGKASLITSGFELSGSKIAGKDYTSPVFIGPFAVGAMCDVKYQAFLNDMYDYLNDYDQQWHGYFENTVALLCMVVLTSNYWTPVDVSVAINDNITNDSSLQLQVYPNPTSTYCSVVFNNYVINEPLVFTIYNQQSQLIQEIPNVSSSININMEGLSKGVYFIKYTNSTIIGNKKIVVN